MTLRLLFVAAIVALAGSLMWPASAQDATSSLPKSFIATVYPGDPATYRISLTTGEYGAVYGHKKLLHREAHLAYDGDEFRLVNQGDADDVGFVSLDSMREPLPTGGVSTRYPIQFETLHFEEFTAAEEGRLIAGEERFAVNVARIDENRFHFDYLVGTDLVAFRSRPGGPIRYAKMKEVAHGERGGPITIRWVFLRTN